MIFSPQSLSQLNLYLMMFLYHWSRQNKNFLKSDELTSYKQRFHIFFSFKNKVVFNIAMIQEINVATVQDLMEQEDDTCFKIISVALIFSPTLTPPVLTGTELAQAL